MYTNTGHKTLWPRNSRRISHT